MNNNGSFSRAVSVIGEQNVLAICLPTNSRYDTVGAATALYLGLNKLGKDVSLSCASQISSQFNLAAVDKIQKNLASGGNNLVISFPYTEGAINKVTYNIENNYFNLLIQPKEGQPKLNPSEVKYSYSGVRVGAIIAIDSPTLESLGDLYLQNQEQFRGKDIINIDRHITNSNFGTINLIDRQSSSTAEIVLRLLKYLNVEIDKDMATNLYMGIASATNNFTAYSVNAQTFEASAQLLKLGAVKKIASPPFSPKVSSTRSRGSFVPQLVEKSAPPQKTIEKKEGKTEEGTPKDWLKPKIFHGRNLV
jgi:nanoRNase/pAp phosphatase (c-di-AMP/oligoRNAs hydrolase)